MPKRKQDAPPKPTEEEVREEVAKQLPPGAPAEVVEAEVKKRLQRE